MFSFIAYPVPKLTFAGGNSKTAEQMRTLSNLTLTLNSVHYPSDIFVKGSFSSVNEYNS